MRSYLKLILIAVILFSSGNVFGGNYIVYNPQNGHYYEFFDSPNTSWEEAKETCANLGGYLVTITSKEEHVYVYDTLGYLANARGKIVFLGGTDEKEEGVWEWITGEDNSYMPMCPGEPNGGTRENHLVFWPGYTGKYCFDDMWDVKDERTSFICEWDYNPFSNEGECENDRYDEGFENGKQWCREHPEECGIEAPGGCVATFDMITNTLFIPNFENQYWLELGLINWNPVQLQLKDYGRLNEK